RFGERLHQAVDVLVNEALVLLAVPVADRLVDVEHGPPPVGSPSPVRWKMWFLLLCYITARAPSTKSPSAGPILGPGSLTLPLPSSPPRRSGPPVASTRAAPTATIRPRKQRPAPRASSRTAAAAALRR